MINVFLVDDHPFFNQGIISSFELENNIQIVGSANSAKEAYEKINTLEVDVVLLDIVMPEVNGIDCCKRLKKEKPGLKVIAFTGELNTKLFFDMWMEKADGILLKTCGLDELTKTIKNVNSGHKIIGDNVPSFLENSVQEEQNIPKMTKREKEVLKYLGMGLTRQETADKMFINMETVGFHCKNIFAKFNDNRINSIITEAKRLRIIK